MTSKTDSNFAKTAIMGLGIAAALFLVLKKST